MVLSGTYGLSSANGLCRGAAARKRLDVRALNNLALRIIFFNLCKACQVSTMAAIPPSAFTAGRIRETQREMKVSKPSKTQGGESFKLFNTKLTELTPLKYNSKLMNSIWGFYNRYSPHNVKKFNDAFACNVELEQSATISTNKNESKITLPSAKLDNVLAAINIS